MRRDLTALTFLLISPLATACLESSRQGTTDADGEETRDTEVSDVPDSRDTSDTPDSPDVDLCAAVDCDDQDECTFDYCEPTTGQCQHIGYPAPSEPPGDPAVPVAPCPEGCDDGDECTSDECVYVPEGCGVGGYYTCVSSPIPGCGGCAGACDDGDPCTVDTCLGTGCDHAPIEGCLAGCTSEGTLPLSTVIDQGPSQNVKTVGTLFFPPLYQACDDGPECGCIGFPGLYDEAANLLLDRPGDFTTDTWSCSSKNCVTPVTECRPAQLGVRYRAWGASIPDFQVGQPTSPGLPAGIIPVRVGAIAVTDFCLETTAAALTGSYSGTWTVEGQAATFKAEIRVETVPMLYVSEVTCPANSFCPQGGVGFSVALTVGDGFVDLSTATLPYPLGSYGLRLYSNRNTLTGRYGWDAVVPFSSGGAQAPRADVAQPPGGQMTLVRLAPTTTSWTPN